MNMFVQRMLHMLRAASWASECEVDNPFISITSCDVEVSSFAVTVGGRASVEWTVFGCLIERVRYQTVFSA